MRRQMVVFLILIGALVLQTTLVSHFAVMGVRPDLILIVVALYGFTRGEVTGAAVGFLGGLLQDLMMAQNLGLGALSKTVVGYVAGLVQRTIFVGNVVLVALSIFVASVLNDSVYGIFSFLFGETVGGRNFLLGIVVPSALYNALLAMVIYLVASRLIGEREGLRLGAEGGRGWRS